MERIYETDRLTLRILSTSYTQDVLNFMTKNKETFEQYDVTRPKNYYTYEYQLRLITVEQNLFDEQRGARYWMFLKGTNEIIGSVSFSHIHDPNKDCSIGYKLAKEYQGFGYATEAVSFLLPLIAKDFEIDRISALIMPSNIPSRELILKLGFTYDTTLKNSHEINGKMEDHLRYYYSS